MNGILKALSHQKQDEIPCWFMRQAGRYLPEYQEIRKDYNILQMFKTPTLACDVTLQPLQRFPQIDGAILFADILLIPDAMGLGLYFDEGPKFQNPWTDKMDLSSIDIHQVIQNLQYVFDAASKVSHALDKDKVLLGFAGAPWTVASYMIEGKNPDEFHLVKKLIYQHSQKVHELLEFMTDITVQYLKKQKDSGAVAFQIFESWAGSLTYEERKEFSYPYLRKIFKEVDLPGILYYGQGMLPSQDLGFEALSVDWRVSLDEVKQKFPQKCIQGNLDPMVLQAPKLILEKKVKDILENVKNHDAGYIFNCGHGLKPWTPVESIHTILNLIKH